MVAFCKLDRDQPVCPESTFDRLQKHLQFKYFYFCKTNFLSWKNVQVVIYGQRIIFQTKNIVTGNFYYSKFLITSHLFGKLYSYY